MHKGYPPKFFTKERILYMPYFIEIDLHSQTVESARKIITNTLKNLPADVREINIIHGYHQGTALRNMIRNYSNSRIERKILGLNQGSTIFIIKKP